MDEHTWNTTLHELIETLDAKVSAAPGASATEALRQLRDALVMLLRPQM